MATRAFGSAKRPIGRAHRTDILGDAVTDLRNDIEEAFQIRENEHDGNLLTVPAHTALGNVGVGGYTLSVLEVASGLAAGTPDTGTRTVTLPTASELVAYIGQASGRSAKVGDGFVFVLRSLGSHNLALAGGTGITENDLGNGGTLATVTSGTAGTFKLRVTDINDPAVPMTVDAVEFFRVA